MARLELVPIDEDPAERMRRLCDRLNHLTQLGLVHPDPSERTGEAKQLTEAIIELFMGRVSQ